MHLLVGFLALGLLIGTCVGLSKSNVVEGLIALLFALIGGSVITLAEKLKLPQLRVSGTAVACLSIGALFGIYSSLYVTEHRLMTPPEVRGTDDAGKTSVDDRKLLRTELMDLATSLEQQVRNNRMTHEEAFKKLQESVSNETK